MTTIKIKFRPSTIDGKEGSLYYQVIHNRIVRQINTGYKLFPSEWASEKGQIARIKRKDNRRDYLLILQKRLRKGMQKWQRIITYLEQNGNEYHTADIVTLYKSAQNNDGFLNFAHRLTDSLKKAGCLRRAETYETTLNSFTRFYNQLEDIPLEDIDSELMLEYENYLKTKGLTPNSTSFYMRNLRAIYNQAVERNLTIQKYPFRHVYTGIEKTIKRAVPLKTIRQIKELNLSPYPLLDYARDLFLFSFYTRGMSFVDMAFLRKKDLHNGILTYRRRKTGQQLFIKWEKPMQAIIDKYDTQESPYLLPIIKTIGRNEWRQYKTAAHLVNQKLKHLGARLDINIGLTMYVARHAWASIAKSKNISTSIISEAMGHDSENTTRIYLASLDTSMVDKANNLIITAL